MSSLCASCACLGEHPSPTHALTHCAPREFHAGPPAGGCSGLTDMVNAMSTEQLIGADVDALLANGDGPGGMSLAGRAKKGLGAPLAPPTPPTQAGGGSPGSAPCLAGSMQQHRPEHSHSTQPLTNETNTLSGGGATTNNDTSALVDVSPNARDKPPPADGGATRGEGSHARALLYGAAAGELGEACVREASRVAARAAAYAGVGDADTALRSEISSVLSQRGASVAVAAAAGECDRSRRCEELVPPSLRRPLRALHARRAEYMDLLSAVTNARERALAALRHGTSSAPAVVVKARGARAALRQRYDAVCERLAAQFRKLANEVLPTDIVRIHRNATPPALEKAAYKRLQASAWASAAEAACPPAEGTPAAGGDARSTTPSGQHGTDVLKRWMVENVIDPHPSRRTKEMLVEQTGLSVHQVSDWFVNARQRVWKPFIERLCAELASEGCVGGGSGAASPGDDSAYTWDSADASGGLSEE